MNAFHLPLDLRTAAVDDRWVPVVERCTFAAASPTDTAAAPSTDSLPVVGLDLSILYTAVCACFGVSNLVPQRLL